MKGHLLRLKKRPHCGILICGVEGSGKRKFIKTFRIGILQNTFADSPEVISQLQFVLVIFLIDGVRTNNLEEEQILKDFCIWQSLNKQINVESILLLNKTDIFLQDRRELNVLCKIRQTYYSILEMHQIVCSGFFPISLRGIAIFRLLRFSQKHDELDILNFRIVLNRISKASFYRLLSEIDFIEHIRHKNNKKEILKLLGAGAVTEFIKNWKRRISI